MKKPAYNLQELNDERYELNKLIGDISDIIFIIEKIENDSRDKIKDILLEKTKELKDRSEAINSFIEFTTKNAPYSTIS